MTTTVQVAFTLSGPTSGTNTNFACGIGLYHTGQNKFESYHIACNGSVGICAAMKRWTDTTTADTALLNNVAVTPSDLMWLQVHDDSTDFVYSFSNNGVDWIEAYRHARADYFSAVPDRVCIMVHNFDNNDREMVANILHWSE